jgi:nucleoside-diphosphate kinase
MEKTFVAIKPDAVSRHLAGRILSRIEDTGLEITEMRLREISTELAELHYEEHREKPFFRSLVDFITSGPAIAMVVEGPSCVEIVRKLVGDTDPLKALPGTIRGDFGYDIERNLIHASDSPESAEREVKLFFPELDPGIVG